MPQIHTVIKSFIWQYTVRHQKKNKRYTKKGKQKDEITGNRKELKAGTVRSHGGKSGIAQARDVGEEPEGDWGLSDRYKRNEGEELRAETPKPKTREKRLGLSRTEERAIETQTE